jgi:4-hydroxy-2-oxoheptanedioate aldolase
MLDRTNRLKRALKAQDTKLAGFWLTTASPTATEIAAGAGFDWLLIDMEHSANELPEVVHHLRAATAGTAEPIVRMPWNEPVLVKRLLDAGARSLLFPYVQNAEEARAAVRATRYPPDGGIRGHSGSSRASDYGRTKAYNTSYHEDVCVIVQAETAEAIGQIGDMAAVDGVDAVFIGPGDLSADMGQIGKGWSSPEVRALAMEGLRSIKRAGKAAGTLLYDEAGAKQLFAEGFDFIAVGSDTTMLARGTDRLAAAYKS